MWQVLICKVCSTCHSTQTHTCIRHVTHNNWCHNDPIIVFLKIWGMRKSIRRHLCDSQSSYDENLSKLKIILLVTQVSICMQYLSYEISLPLHTPTSVCIFSTLFSIHFQRCWQGEFVHQSKASLVGDHLLYSCDPTFWSRSDIVWRN